MNSFEKYVNEDGVGSTDFIHIIVAKRAYLAGLRRAAGIAVDAEHNKHAIIKAIESEASLIEGKT